MNTQNHTTKPNPEPSPTPTPLTIKPKPRKHRRNGAIARLPKLERDLVNQMLSDGATYPNIVEALDEVGQTVTARNVSNWARGGHLDWLKAQEHVLQNQARQDSLVDLLRDEDATQLPEVGLQFAATTLSELLVNPGNLQADLDKYLRVIRTLCRLSREIFKLQKYRDDGARSLGKDENPDKIKKENRELFTSLRQDYGPNSTLHLDPQMQDPDPATDAQPAPAPDIDPPFDPSGPSLRPDGTLESVGLWMLRASNEAAKAQREAEAAAASKPAPPPDESHDLLEPSAHPSPEEDPAVTRDS